MNRLSSQLGYWSALLSALTFFVFTICFVAIVFTAPPFLWTNLEDYIAYVHANSRFFADLARLCMLLFGPLFVILLNSIHDYAPAEKHILTRNSITFGIMFATLICVHYFVQLSTVRINIQKEQYAGIEHFLQANPNSAISAINMLGWTLFLGLSSLFAAPVFSGNRLENVIKVAFLLNAVFCLVGGIAYIFEIRWLLFITINFGMGGAVTTATIALAVLFKKIKHSK